MDQQPLPRSQIILLTVGRISAGLSWSESRPNLVERAACRCESWGSRQSDDYAAKATLIYSRRGNLRAVQLLLGHTKIERTVRGLGIEVDDALAIAEQVDVLV
jgi:hypothetical protein